MSNKLSKKHQVRDRLMKNLLTSLLLYEQISTTQAKAKELKSVAQKFVHAISLDNDGFNIVRLINNNVYAGARKKAFDKRKDFSVVKLYKTTERAGDGALLTIVKLETKKENKNENKSAKPTE